MISDATQPHPSHIHTTDANFHQAIKADMGRNGIQVLHSDVKTFDVDSDAVAPQGDDKLVGALTLPFVGVDRSLLLSDLTLTTAEENGVSSSRAGPKRNFRRYNKSINTNCNCRCASRLRTGAPWRWICACTAAGGTPTRRRSAARLVRFVVKHGWGLVVVACAYGLSDSWMYDDRRDHTRLQKKQTKTNTNRTWGWRSGSTAAWWSTRTYVQPQTVV